jgi:hypothetical protein
VCNVCFEFYLYCLHTHAQVEDTYEKNGEEMLFLHSALNNCVLTSELSEDLLEQVGGV